MIGTTLSTRRIGLLVVTVLALLWVLGTLVFTTVDLVSQATSGTIRTVMYQSAGLWSFQDTGDGTAGAPVIAGGSGPAVVTVSVSPRPRPPCISW